MGPTLSAVGRAGAHFADAAQRPRLRAWLVEGVPFLDMIKRLGFDRLVDDDLRAAIEGLDGEAVATIRQVAIAEIDRLGDAAQAELPFECTLARIEGPVDVTRRDTDGRPVVVITAADS